MDDSTAKTTGIKWTYLLPRTAELLLRRELDAEERDALVVQLHRAGVLLTDERFERMTGYYTLKGSDWTKMVALLVTAGIAVDEPVDALLTPLSPDECHEVIERVNELQRGLPVEEDDLSRVRRRAATRLRVEPVAHALAAATPVRSSQRSGIRRFKVSTHREAAEVEVRFGAGPVKIRQVGGRLPLTLSGWSAPLPTRDVVEVDVEDGTEMAGWLEEHLRLMDSDGEPAERP